MKIKALHENPSLTVVCALLAFGCSSDTKAGPGGSTADAGSSAGGASGDGGACTATVKPGTDDAKTIQNALEAVNSGDTLCLAPGTYKLNRSLSLSSANNVTFRGTGAKRDDVLLDFSAQSKGDGGIGGAEGMLVSTEGFTIQNLSIKNSAGNGIKVTGNHATFRNIKVGWDDAKTSNGAYAIYPTGIDDVLLEDSEAYGAADAGVYTGQCTHVIVRHNLVHDSVLGIEIENTTGAEVYENETHDNTCGMLLDLLPGLEKKTSENYLVHDNNIHDNNHPNFADPKSVAGLMQQGTGILLLAASHVEIKGNKIANNGGAGIDVISYDFVDIAAAVTGGKADAPDISEGGILLTNRWPEHISIHDNTFTGNGQDPQGSLYGTAATQTGTGKIPYAVLWDGILKHQMDGDGGLITPDDAAADICLGTAEAASFLNWHGTGIIDKTKWTTDATAHQCTTPITVPPLVP